MFFPPLNLYNCIQLYAFANITDSDKHRHVESLYMSLLKHVETKLCIQHGKAHTGRGANTLGFFAGLFKLIVYIVISIIRFIPCAQ